MLHQAIGCFVKFLPQIPPFISSEGNTVLWTISIQKVFWYFGTNSLQVETWIFVASINYGLKKKTMYVALATLSLIITLSLKPVSNKNKVFLESEMHVFNTVCVFILHNVSYRGFFTKFIGAWMVILYSFKLFTWR